MKNRAKKFSPTIFGLALICFFLPFIEVSCQGQKIVTYTGIQMITGTTIEQPDLFGTGKQSKKVDPEPLAIFAFFSGVMGLGLSFLKGRKSSVAPAIAGIIGVIALLLLKSKLNNEILKEGGGMLQLEYGVGFWLTFVLYLSAIGLNIFLLSGSKRQIEKQV